MATTQIPWGDGSNDKLYFDADSMVGNQTVAVSSDPNSGAAERSKIVNFNASGVQPQPLQIVQLGSGGIDFDAWLKDGDTHLWINIISDDLKSVSIRLRMIGTIDWGDGNTESINVTSYTTKTHTYSDTGKYRIDLKPTSGTFYLGGGSSSYNVMDSRTNARLRNCSILYQAEIGTKRITTISAYAFYFCVGLQRAYIPKNIISFGTYAFGQCFSLYLIEFENANKITSVGASTFYNCYCLKNNIDLQSSHTSEASIVRNCYCINGYTINFSVTEIAASGLAGLYGIKEFRCLPTNPPTVANSNAFTSFNTSCSIKVPIGCLSAYQSANIWSTYSAQMVEAGTIKATLTNVTLSNTERMTDKNESYTNTLIPDDGKTLGTVTVKMGGVDVTNTVYSNGVITIANVTGNIEIIATAA